MHDEFKSLPLVNSGQVALVDAADYLRVARHRWSLDALGYVFRYRTVAGRRERLLLHRAILNAPARAHVRFRDGERRNCRRSNLRLCPGGCVSHHPRQGRKPWRVTVSVDDEQYVVGMWPTRAWAEDIRARAVAAARQLRGRGLTRKQVQRALDVAAGRRIPSRVTSRELLRAA